MEVKTIKQVADEWGVTYEAVRRLAARYSDEITDHIHERHRVKYLDEYAVDYLRERRRESPVVSVREDQDAEIEALRAQVEELRARLMAAQEKVSGLQDALIDSQRRELSLSEEVRQSMQARLEYDAMKDDAAAARAEAEQIRRESSEQIDALQKEVASFRPSLFGFYRKV